MYIKVKVQPNSKKEQFEKIANDKFSISVKQKAVMNMANKRVLELLAEHFNLAVGKLKIISGHRSPSKIISIDI